MKLGRYLVERGLIDDDALLAALVRQIEEQPSVAHVIYTEKLLSAKDQLAVLERQWSTGAEYRRASADLGLWTPQIDAAVRRHLAGKRTPVGQVLLKAGQIEMDVLTKAFDDFLARPTPQPAAVPAAVPVAPAARQAASPAAQRYFAFYDEAKQREVARLDRPALLQAARQLLLMARVADLPDAVAEWERTLAALEKRAA